ncbi:hypothetical protein BJ085DRAFT_18196, partial [Dimargaris cristalligena]
MRALHRLLTHLWGFAIPLLLICWPGGTWTLGTIPALPYFGVSGLIVVEATNQTFTDRSAAFGPPPSEAGLVGSLVALPPTDPTNRFGCRPFRPPAGLSPQPWFALVERGECAFIDKVRNMQQSGASAVIVGDPFFDTLVTMYASEDTSDINIPSVFIARTHYRELRAVYRVLPAPVLTRLVQGDLYSLPVADVILITVLSPGIMLLFVYALYRVRLHRRQKRDLAPVSVVSNLPSKAFFVAKRLPNEPEECAICLEDYVDDDELRILPCRHQFHCACVDLWLTTRKKCCPICKQDV